MNVIEKFLELTKWTIPYGKEHELKPLLPKEIKRDNFGNYYIQIGDKTSVMFTSHLDTYSNISEEVNHVIEDDFIKSDGTTILGADDKAGVTIMLYMIYHKIPGLYYFFIGEERGCIGSCKLVDRGKKFKNINKIISFDRKGTDSVITHQIDQRTCSDIFASALVEQLNKNGLRYRLDKNGGSTDSYHLGQIYREATNISVGYYNEHKKNEKQSISHLIALSKACLTINWEELPVKRENTFLMNCI